MKYAILSWGIFFTLIFCILKYGKKGNNKKTLPNPNRNIDCVDQYHVDSTGKHLIRWDGDTVKP